MSGIGAAGVACSRILLLAGVKHLVACSRRGIVFSTEESGHVISCIGEEFNKLTDRWIHAPIQILHAGIPASLAVADIAAIDIGDPAAGRFPDWAGAHVKR